MKKAVAVVPLATVAIVAGVWWVAFRQKPSVSVAADIRAIEFRPLP